MSKSWLQRKDKLISVRVCFQLTKKIETICKIHIFHSTSWLPQSSFGLEQSEELVIAPHKHTLSYYLNYTLP